MIFITYIFVCHLTRPIYALSCYVAFDRPSHGSSKTHKLLPSRFKYNISVRVLVVIPLFIALPFDSREKFWIKCRQLMTLTSMKTRALPSLFCYIFQHSKTTKQTHQNRRVRLVVKKMASMHWTSRFFQVQTNETYPFDQCLQ